MTRYPFEEQSILLIKGKLCAAMNAIRLKSRREMPKKDRLAYEEDPEAFLEEAVKYKAEYRYYTDENDIEDMLSVMDVEHTYVRQFQGTITSVRNPVDVEKTYDEFLCCLMPLKKPSLYEQAYGSIDELEEEYRSRLDGLIPEGFDLKPYFFDVSGTYYS